MHALILLYINQHTKFEVSSFTYYTDMIGGKILKKGHVSLTSPHLGLFITAGLDTVYLHAKLDDSSFSRQTHMQ